MSKTRRREQRSKDDKNPHFFFFSVTDMIPSASFMFHPILTIAAVVQPYYSSVGMVTFVRGTVITYLWNPTKIFHSSTKIGNDGVWLRAPLSVHCLIVQINDYFQPKPRRALDHQQLEGCSGATLGSLFLLAEVMEMQKGLA